MSVDKELFDHVIVAVFVLDEEGGLERRAALHDGLVVVVLEQVVVVFVVVGVHGPVDHQHDEMRQVVEIINGRLVS